VPTKVAGAQAKSFWLTPLHTMFTSQALQARPWLPHALLDEPASQVPALQQPAQVAGLQLAFKSCSSGPQPN
jgi:hypothetical protein